ncbi:hypothetical protein PC110_g12638 [Phytophthora cactorum]|uniref:Uncharacterized protein n=1 Tax=Phytophthora cactorum TaxID=29920 RepID=A0A329S539_9STRA|nr:hypothetical protein PC110_g12638 [Phytophthora cactorum]
MLIVLVCACVACPACFIHQSEGGGQGQIEDVNV